MGEESPSEVDVNFDGGLEATSDFIAAGRCKIHSELKSI